MGIALGLEAKPRCALLLGADPDIGDDLLQAVRLDLPDLDLTGDHLWLRQPKGLALYFERGLRQTA
jgi:hypothetical protein